MVEYTPDELLIIGELKRYVHPQDYNLNDWKTIISRVERVKPNLYKYHTNKMDLYFDDELYIQEYDKVHIIDGKVFYDFNEDSSQGSGTYTYYKKYLEPYGVDLSKKYLGKHQERFTDMTPKSKIRKDETPYIMLGSRYYVAKEVYNEGDCRPLSIVDEDGNAISKPIYLYFAGYNTDGGEAFWIPKEMKELLIQINPKFNDVIKDNKLPRDNETVVVVLNQYLKD